MVHTLFPCERGLSSFETKVRGIGGVVVRRYICLCCVILLIVFQGTLMLLPVAIMLGELWTFDSLREKSDKIGFLDREDLHTPSYILLNIFAGELVVELLT